jgi:hypothetical protein
MTWPEARLDRVRQLRVLGAALPGVAVVERVLDAPFDEVWSFLSDLERSVPMFDHLVDSLHLKAGHDDRLSVVARLPVVHTGTRFDVELHDGWCWMQSRTYLVGMAAEPHGEQTRYAHLEGVPFRRARLLKPLLRPLFRAVVGSDVRGIARIVEHRGT